MAMTDAEREEMRQVIRTANTNAMRQALYSLLHQTKKADADEAANPEDKTLGWFADGMDTACHIVVQTLRASEVAADAG